MIKRCFQSSSLVTLLRFLESVLRSQNDVLSDMLILAKTVGLMKTGLSRSYRVTGMNTSIIKEKHD